jgi:hypothetical protein
MIPSVDHCPRLSVTPDQPFRDSHLERPAIQSAIQNVITYTTGRPGQRSTLGIIFDIFFVGKIIELKLRWVMSIL